ncbi:hypothetical protein GCM10027051_04100 [Niabella terrae]
MRHYFLFLAVLFWLMGLSTSGYCQTDQGVRLHFSTAYNRTDLRWSIAGDIHGADPNILSELIWRRQTGPVSELGLSIPLNRKLETAATFSYQPILSGNAVDIDYLNNNRQGEVYHADLNANRGHQLSASLQARYTATANRTFSWKLLTGFDYRQQMLWLLGDRPETAGVESSYRNYWIGGLAGMDFNWLFHRYDLLLHGDGRLYSYQAKAQWNQIEVFEQPVSFRHFTGAYALSGRLEAGYRLLGQLRLYGFSELYHADGWKGLDRAYYTDQTTFDTRLNWVTTTSLSLGLGLNYQF